MAPRSGGMAPITSGPARPEGFPHTLLGDPSLDVLGAEPVHELRGGIQQDGGAGRKRANAVGGTIGYSYFDVADAVAVGF